MSVSSLGFGSEHSTFIVQNRENLHKLIDVILDINEEEESLGEYAICLTEESGTRVDVVWSCDDDPIVFGTECSVLKSIEEECEDGEEEDRENM